MNKESIIRHTLKLEGGYVNDPYDLGGETKYGITIKTARKAGYQGDMKDLTVDKAVEIYETLYWTPLKLDNFDIRVAQKLFDIAVNTGVRRAGIILQRALNVLNNNKYPETDIDGVIGKGTIGTYNNYINYRKGEEGIKVLLKTLNILLGFHYIKISENRVQNKKFTFGWIKNRVHL